MKNKPNIALIVLLLATVQVGCQSPAKTVYASATALHTANEVMLNAFESGRITRDQFQTYAIAAKSASAALTKVENARLTGDSLSIDELTSIAKVEVAKALLIRLETLGESK